MGIKTSVDQAQNEHSLTVVRLRPECHVSALMMTCSGSLSNLLIVDMSKEHTDPRKKAHTCQGVASIVLRIIVRRVSETPV